MADIVTFDGVNLIVQEISTGGDNVINWTEIYSEWKDWSRLSDNIKYPPLFTYEGGIPTEGADTTGIVHFWNSGAGWRFRPAELDHEVSIGGNVWPIPQGSRIVVPTVGAYTVLVKFKVSNIIDKLGADEYFRAVRVLSNSRNPNINT